jgi:hypothetical protein
MPAKSKSNELKLSSRDKTPRLGQRVRFTGTHQDVPRGLGGFIELIRTDQFFVLTDSGGFFGWTSFDSWEPTGEPDEELSAEFRAMREEAVSTSQEP